MRSLSALLLTTSLFLSGACVPQGKYEKALAEHAKSSAKLRNDSARARAELTEERARQQWAEQEIEVTSQHAQRCERELDEATAIHQKLASELERTGRDVNALLTEKGTLASSLDDAKKRLEELRRAQQASEERARLFRDLASRLKRMIDAGELQIVLREGRMVLVLPNDVLFDSGQARIKPGGAAGLAQVALVLSTLEERRFQVAGHTDNDPIRYSGYESNWELSSARALEVTRFLIEHGVKPQVLSAAGYGEFDPVRPNDAADDKAKNRRIEITLMPNIAEIVTVPDGR
jgi:chemotaxis protein MotB